MPSIGDQEIGDEKKESCATKVAGVALAGFFLFGSTSLAFARDTSSREFYIFASAAAACLLVSATSCLVSELWASCQGRPVAQPAATTTSGEYTHLMQA